MRVTDHKTGRVRDRGEYVEQLELYALGAMLMFDDVDEVVTTIRYLDHGIEPEKTYSYQQYPQLRELVAPPRAQDAAGRRVQADARRSAGGAAFQRPREDRASMTKMERSNEGLAPLIRWMREHGMLDENNEPTPWFRAVSDAAIAMDDDDDA